MVAEQQLGLERILLINMAKVHFTRFPGAEHERAVKLKPRTMRMNGETRSCEWSCRGSGQRIFSVCCSWIWLTVDAIHCNRREV